MIVLCVDQDGYSEALDAALRASGGLLIRTDYRDALSKLLSEKCDAVIVDVEVFHPTDVMESVLLPTLPPETHARTRELFSNVGNERGPDPYQVIREITNTGWGRTNQVVVWTRISLEEFSSRATNAGLQLQQIRFYSKFNLEIPPELDCIRQQILEDPSCIGFDFAKHVPTEITEDWILQQPVIYPFLEQYVMGRALKGTSQNELEEINQMSRGYRWVYLIWVCYGCINNGGFRSLWEHVFAIDEPETIVETFETL